MPKFSLFSKLRSKSRLQLIVALLLAFIGLYSATFSLALVNDERNPDLALAVSDTFSKAAVRKGDLLIATVGPAALERASALPNQETDPPSLITGYRITLNPQDALALAGLARTALAANPYSAGALRQLAYLEAGAAQKGKLLTLAQRTSRRDTLVSLQLAELRFRRNEAELGVAGLNRSLVTSARLDGVIFPILLSVAGEPEYRRTIGRILSQEPVWMKRLFDWALDNPEYTPTLARLARYVPEQSVAREYGFGPQMVDLLIQQQAYGEAFDTYRAFAGSAPDPTEMTASAYPPLDWRLIDNYDSGARIFDDDTVEIFANPARTGNVAQLVTALNPGRYTLAFDVSETVGRDGEILFLQTCLSRTGGESAGGETRVLLRNGDLRIPISVPPGCDFQRLALSIAGGNEASGALLRSVRLSPNTAAE